MRKPYFSFLRRHWSRLVSALVLGHELSLQRGAYFFSAYGTSLRPRFCRPVPFSMTVTHFRVTFWLMLAVSLSSGESDNHAAAPDLLLAT